jgi:hypothetical protein
MVGMPKFTKRAAEQIARLEEFHTRDLPPGKYMSCVGWGGDLDADPGPVIGLHYVEAVPEEFQIECHGVRLAYNFPTHVLATLHSSVLDFDGERFVFVESGDAEQA